MSANTRQMVADDQLAPELCPSGAAEGCGSTTNPGGPASFVSEKAGQAIEAVGAGMESLGGTIRARKPNKGILSDAGAAVADKLEAGGQYLEAKGLDGIGQDITDLIRKNPVPALLVGVGLGFILARFFRR